MKIDPHNPFTNLLFIYQELLLLEDHCFVEAMNCSHCISKHVNRIIAYLNECYSLINNLKKDPTFNKTLLQHIDIFKNAFLNTCNANILKEGDDTAALWFDISKNNIDVNRLSNLRKDVRKYVLNVLKEDIND